MGSTDFSNPDVQSLNGFPDEGGGELVKEAWGVPEPKFLPEIKQANDWMDRAGQAYDKGRNLLLGR